MEKTKEKINSVLEKVRPYVQMHGGDVELVEIRENVAILKIHGACVHCSLAQLTYNKTIGPLIKEEAPEITEVIFE